jgi:hypothetical protein
LCIGATMKSSASGARIEHKSFERVQNFEEAFNKIRTATGITDIEELVRYIYIDIYICIYRYIYIYIYMYIFI